MKKEELNYNDTIKEIKIAAKNKTGATLRITKKNFKDEELPYELRPKRDKK